MNKILPLAFCLLLTVPAARAECAPATMLKIVVVNASPGVEQGSAAAFPKTIYRLGASKGRWEEAPDRANGIEGIRIINAPDSWIVDPIDMAGTYRFDNSSGNRFRAPVLAWAGVPGMPEEFELGCELEWLEAQPDARWATVDVGGREMRNAAIDRGPYRINFTLDGPTGLPIAVGVFLGDELVHYLEYLEYRRIDPPNLRLFLPPSGVEIDVVE